VEETTEKTEGGAEKNGQEWIYHGTRGTRGTVDISDGHPGCSAGDSSRLN